jgi:hypothetical protein
MVLLLSRASVASGWVQQEFHAAINHQSLFRDFRIIPLRLDDVEPPGFLANYSNVALPEGNADAAAAAAVLRGLYQPHTAVDPAGARAVFLSRGWRPDDQALVDDVATALAAAGLQLLGDAEDRPTWGETRVGGVMSGCGAFAAVLPFRPHEPHTTSRYVLREWALAAGRGLPCLVVADPRVTLSEDQRQLPGLVPGAVAAAGRPGLDEAAMSLAESWQEPARSPYVFFATDFVADRSVARRVVKDLVESVTGLPCLVADYVEGGAVVQQEILRRVSGATLVLADISAGSPNVYVEVGAARGAGVPVALLRRGAPGRPPFMLRDQQVWDYVTDADMLGRVLRLIRPHRRALLTPPVS